MPTSTRRDPSLAARNRMRKMHPVRVFGQVAYAVRVEGCDVVLACGRCGHEDRCPQPDAFFARKMLRYWSKENNGISAFCAKCDPAEYKAWARRRKKLDQRLRGGR